MQALNLCPDPATSSSLDPSESLSSSDYVVGVRGAVNKRAPPSCRMRQGRGRRREMGTENVHFGSWARAPCRRVRAGRKRGWGCPVSGEALRKRWCPGGGALASHAGVLRGQEGVRPSGQRSSSKEVTARLAAGQRPCLYLGERRGKDAKML